MSDVLAIKIIAGKPQRQRFSRKGWDLLGPDKNGWNEVDEQNIENDIQILKNKAGKNGQVLTNDVKTDLVKHEEKTELKPPQNKTDEIVLEEDDPKLIEFLKHTKGLNKGTIKDYFDRQEPPVKYDNAAGIEVLKRVLAVHLKYNIVELQKALS